MRMMRGKADANQGRIVDALRKVGAWIKIVSVYPKMLDLLVYYRGRLYWLEVKQDSRQKLTSAEQDIFDACSGVTHRVHNVEEALRVINVTAQ